MNGFIVFGVLALIGVHQSYGSARCEEGWESFGAACYFISGMTENWYDANDLCKATGGSLVRINSRHENEYLKMRARSVNSTNNYWIDGTDESEEGRWVYSGAGKSDLSFTDWNPGQPNNFEDRQHCLGLYRRFDFKWDDDDCSTRRLFICEKYTPTTR